jgi:tetratricopeptide (TPR) repeat protein
MLGHVLSRQGRHQEARAAAERARAIDPLSSLSHTMSAQIAFCARDPEEAVRHAREALLADPDDWVAHWQLGQAFEQLDRVEDALAALAEASRLSRGNTKPVSLSAYTLATRDRAREARDILRDLERLVEQRYVPPCALALVHAGLNDADTALEWLERALIARDVHLIYVPLDPKWDAFCSDERFQRLLQRCGPPRGVGQVPA